MSRFLLGDRSSEAVDACVWRTDASLGSDMPNKFLGVANVADTAPAFCEMIGSAVFNTDITKETTTTRAGNCSLKFASSCSAGKGFRTAFIPVREGEMVDAIVGYEASGTSVAFAAFLQFYQRNKTTQVGGDQDLFRGAAGAAATKYTKRIATAVPANARFARLRVEITGAAAQTVTIDTLNLVTTPIGGYTGLVPIGSVLAWHKDLSGVPALPSNFVECNGQTLSDKDSPLDGQVIPDLNVGSGTGRFLRGTTGTTGATQSGQIESHSHTGPSHSHTVNNIHLHYVDNGSGTPTNMIAVNARGPTPDASWPTDNGSFAENTTLGGTGSTGSTGSGETRPINMTVRWIMRIK